MNSGLSPNCQQEGKTDQAAAAPYQRALNRLPEEIRPLSIKVSRRVCPSAGKRIGESRGIVVGGDMTDDGGGQTVEPREGTQLLRVQPPLPARGDPTVCMSRSMPGWAIMIWIRMAKPPNVDWYRRELRDYVEVNHEPGDIFKPPVPAANFDPETDCYSWNWGPLHLVQLHRFGGDTRKGAVSSIPWLKDDLRTAGAGRPVVLFQHYGWDPFSLENWDPAKTTFDDKGGGCALVERCWSAQTLLEALSPDPR